MQVLMAMDGNTSCNIRILHDFFNDGETLDLSPPQQQLKDDGFPWGFFDPKKHVSRRHPDDRRGIASWGVWKNHPNKDVTMSH